MRRHIMVIHQPKPILKWAGGKAQLISQIYPFFPSCFGDKIKKYAEPFVGGGALLFDILSKYHLDDVYISDVNGELINMYLMVRDHVNELISILQRLSDTFLPLMDYDRRAYYYQKRDEFNSLITSGQSKNGIESAALFIFLNRTCFNGLYRANKNGLFNVPMGVYKNPVICNPDLLREASAALQNVVIVCGDYRLSDDFIDDTTLVYLDPPYRPLKGRDSFISYTEKEFDDNSQLELAQFFNHITEKGAYALLSNSDPRNVDDTDSFFEDLYANYDIQKIYAKRIINRNVDSRGKISELLIRNYID